MTEHFEQQRIKLLDSMQKALVETVFEVWFPRCVDTVNGGYKADFDYAWNPTGPGNKMITNQARHLFGSSLAAMLYPEDAVYRPAADNGFRWLRDKMWDHEYGGFFYNVNEAGKVQKFEWHPNASRKDTYGHAFAIFALAEYALMSREDSSLKLAADTFRWIDKNAHDPVCGSYFSQYERDGSLELTSMPEQWGRQMERAKDQNSLLHLLESFNQLYRLWPDPLLRERIAEMAAIWCTKMIDPRGFTRPLFKADWTDLIWIPRPRPAHKPRIHRGAAMWGPNQVNFGHDIEYAYFVLEARDLAGVDNGKVPISVIRNVLDHAIKWGWDKENGGFFTNGTKVDDRCEVPYPDKIWWVQAEALHILLFMARYFKSKEYFGYFLATWEYIQKHCLDHTYGGWYHFCTDCYPERTTEPKGEDWKASYHDGRALWHCCEILKEPEGWEFLGESDRVTE